MPHRVIWLNGQFLPESAAKVSIFDAGLLYGEMAFEMTRTFRHEPFHLDFHLGRLFDTLAFLQIDCRLTPAEIEAATRETLARNLPTEAADVDWHVRHDISRGPAELYAAAVPGGQQPTVMISCWPLLKAMGRFAPHYEQGVRLMVSSQRSLPPELINPRAKTRSRVHFQLAQMEAAQRGHLWPVLTDEQGCLTEGPSWNLFLVRNGTLLTSRGHEVLPGVSRRITFEAAARLGIPARETEITPEMARTADEILCTATSFGLVYGAEFEGQPINDRQPGPVFQALLSAWKEIVGLDFVAQAQSYAPRVAEWEVRERAAITG